MYSVKSGVLFVLLCLMLLINTLSGCISQQVSALNSLPPQNADEKRIDEDNMLSIVKELSSEKYMGRKPGTEGNELAAGYIAEYFSKIGLKKPEGLEDYKQYYEQPVLYFNSTPKFQLLSDKGEAYCDYRYPEDFTFRLLSSSSSNIDIKAQLYLIKELNEINPDNRNIDGKLLLVPFSLFRSISYELLNDCLCQTNAAGAAVEVNITGENRMFDALAVPPMIYQWSNETVTKPILDVRNGTFKQLESLAKESQMVGLSHSYTKDDHCRVPNIVGYIPASDEKYKNEQIILGAHFDAMGNNMDGTYNPGSLDNASGTAAIMEMARILKETKTSLKKSIVFIAFNGEEEYLKGSGFYAGHPVFPLDKAMLINLDMVGSTKKIPITVAAGGGKNTELLKWFCKTAREMGIDTLPMAGGLCDEMSFSEKGVPSVSLVNFTRRGGYHTPDDNGYDVDKLRMEQYVKLVLRYIDEHAY